jgi:arginase family enzyme
MDLNDDARMGFRIIRAGDLDVMGVEAVVGADIVEVAPAYDHAEITCVAAATVVFDLLSLMVASDSSR